MDDEVALLVADVYELAGILRRLGEALAATEGQTQARWQLLSAISADGMTVPRAARRLGITRQAVQRASNELVSDGLAEFQENPDHRTSPLLSPTVDGRRVLSAINRRAATAHHRLRESVGTTAIEDTRSGIKQLIAALMQ
ncbi:MarR family winged helix-turn-helix transcriptional regulator [soil metagenome]